MTTTKTTRKALRVPTSKDQPKCYAGCDAPVVGARIFNPAERAATFEHGGEIVCACARHAEVRKVRIVTVCALCTMPAPRGVVIDGEVYHVSCHGDACR